MCKFPVFHNHPPFVGYSKSVLFIFTTVWYGMKLKSARRYRLTNHDCWWCQQLDDMTLPRNDFWSMKYTQSPEQDVINCFYLPVMFFGWENSIKFPFNTELYISTSEMFSLKLYYRLILQIKERHTWFAMGPEFHWLFGKSSWRIFARQINLSPLQRLDSKKDKLVVVTERYLASTFQTSW